MRFGSLRFGSLRFGALGDGARSDGALRDGALRDTGGQEVQASGGLKRAEDVPLRRGQEMKAPGEGIEAGPEDLREDRSGS